MLCVSARILEGRLRDMTPASDITAESGPRVLEIPEGDNRERLVCPDCGFINYENPKIVVGSVVGYDKKILLCRRDIRAGASY